jgi:hypothetical protein
MWWHGKVFSSSARSGKVILAGAALLSLSANAAKAQEPNGFFNEDYKRALSYAQQHGRPIFVEITEHG